MTTRNHGTFYKDTWGFKIIIAFPSDISDSLSSEVLVRKPNDSILTRSASLEDNYRISYLVEDGLLDIIGNYKIQVVLYFDNSKVKGSVFSFLVKEGI